MKKELSCIDCAVKNCQTGDKTYPDFCVTTHMNPETLGEALDCYGQAENHKVTLASANVECEHYCQYTRVEEIVSQLREERGLAETPPWTISYYPPGGQVGLIEFVMAASEDGGETALETSEDATAENLGEEA